MRGLDRYFGMSGRRLLSVGQAILCFGLSAFVLWDLGWDDGSILAMVLGVVGLGLLAQAYGIGPRRK